MIKLVEVLGYRCLRYVSPVELSGFQVLVGPNGSGKSTFLDAIRLLGDLLKEGVLPAIRARSPNFLDLTWMGRGQRFEILVELEIPEERRSRLTRDGYDRARYEVAVGLNDEGEIAVLDETLWLKEAQVTKPRQMEIFPSPPEQPPTIVVPARSHAPKGWKKVVAKKAISGNDYFFSETTGWNSPFRLGPQRLALANLPEDEERFPVATWLKRVLMEGTQLLALDAQSMRRPTPPGSPTDFQPDGSNLPRAIEALKAVPKLFDRWTAHVRSALPDILTIETVERPEDLHRYLQIVYSTGLKVPSWNVSDGTLRLLALTLLAYLAAGPRIYLVEEPENGIHPRAVETVFQSVSSAYGSQILCASHSPVVLSLAKPEQLLCFSRSENGAADIVRGTEHPYLRDWQRGTDLGTLFATGVLG